MKKKLSIEEAGNVCTKKMPKEMSDWIDERLLSGQHVRVEDKGKQGYAMKSEDCTIVFFPNWNCDSQFCRVVNKFR